MNWFNSKSTIVISVVGNQGSSVLLCYCYKIVREVLVIGLYKDLTIVKSLTGSTLVWKEEPIYTYVFFTFCTVISKKTKKSTMPHFQMMSLMKKVNLIRQVVLWHLLLVSKRFLISSYHWQWAYKRWIWAIWLCLFSII